MFRGNEFNSVSFLPTFKKSYKKYDNKSLTASFHHESDRSLTFDKSWQFYNYFAYDHDIVFAQNTTKYPNKALVTINGRDSEVKMT